MFVACEYLQKQMNQKAQKSVERILQTYQQAALLSQSHTEIQAFNQIWH